MFRSFLGRGALFFFCLGAGSDRIPKKIAVEHLKSEVSNAFDVIIAGVPGKRLASRGTVSVVSFNWVTVEGIWSDFVENLFLF